MKLWQKLSLIFFGLILTIVILEIGLRIGGFIILSIQKHRNQESIKQKSTCRIMCIGESTTQNQYPVYLEEILNKRDIGIKFSVIDKGLSACNTSIIMGQLEKNLNEYYPDIVVAMIGINDHGQHMLYKSIPNTRIGKILKHLKSYQLLRLFYFHGISKVKNIKNRQPDFHNSSGTSTLSSDQRSEFSVSADPSIFIKKGRKSFHLNRLSEAEEYFRQGIMRDPSRGDIFFSLGQVLYYEGKFLEAEKCYKRAIELDPRNDNAFAGLGALYISLGHTEYNQKLENEAEAAFKKSVEINPNNGWALTMLGWCYFDKNLLDEAAEFFKKAFELSPENEVAFNKLNEIYLRQKKFSQSREIIIKAIEQNPNNGRFYRIASMLFKEMGDNVLSRKYSEKAKTIDQREYDYITQDNYFKISKILNARNVKLVCMQYPMRSINSLRKMLSESKNAIFVDNEKLFKNAVAKEGYKEYFTDMFGGDFGHCTNKGNRLLAENIANVILKEVFNK